MKLNVISQRGSFQKIHDVTKALMETHKISMEKHGKALIETVEMREERPIVR